MWSVAASSYPLMQVCRLLLEVSTIPEKREDRLQIIPLGGVGEIGKNMMVLRYGNDIMVIDAGLKFPEEDMLGIDLVIPNISYLLEHEDKVRGIVLTHGHEDHIGGLPYVLRQIQPPIYGSRLTLGLLEGKLKEHKIDAQLNVVTSGQSVKLGNSFSVEFINSNHSIPDSFCMAITTPAGVIIHTGDFKLDQTPVSGPVTDLQRLAEYGRHGVLALFCDSTNAEREGYTKSERLVGRTFDEIFRTHLENRIIIASFASHIHRVQQVFDVAVKHNRRVTAVGRSMINNIEVASRLGYLKFPEKVYVGLDDIGRIPDHELVVISTGSQGEPLSGLTRMASQSHRKICIGQGDLVILSSTPIPGNEKLVNRVINGLYRCGAKVIDKGIADVHVSGHAASEEIKLVLNLVRPKFLLPFHGEYRHQISLAKLGEEVGIPRENSMIMDIGDVVEVGDEIRKVGRVQAGMVFVDGLGIGDVGNVVLRDRRHLAQDGVVTVVVTIDKETHAIVAGPDIITRGFVYVRESERLIESASKVVSSVLAEQLSQGASEWSSVKASVREALSNFLFEKTQRQPMILPIIMEI